MKYKNSLLKKISPVVVGIVILLICPTMAYPYGITSISGSGWSGTLNYSANSTIYLCYGSSVTLYSDVPASTTVGGTVYYKKWQYSGDAVTWSTTNNSTGMPTYSYTQYYRCVQRSTGGVVLAGSETPWVRIIFGPSYVSMPTAVSTSGYTGTQFDAHWTTSSTAHGPGNLAIRHYLFCSTTSDFQANTAPPGQGFNSACAKLITACSDGSSAIAGCTYNSTPVTYTVTGLTPGVTYYWKVLAQSYHEESSNGDLWCGVQSSYTVIQSVPSCSPPQVTSHPVSQAVCTGSSVTFSVTASGSPTLTYQWRKNGSDIGGATNSTYSINPVTAGDTGSYTVYVTNSCGNATSNAAILTLAPSPVITTQPSDIIDACPGTNVSFSVTATGSPITYQWQVSTNGGASYTNITAAGSNPVYSGWTSSTLGISNVSPANNYMYRCIAGSTCLPNDTSDAAHLWVSDGPGPVTVNGSGTYCGSTVITASGLSGFTIYFQGTTSGGTSQSTPSSSETITGSGIYYFRTFDGNCWGTEGSAAVTINAVPGAVSVSGDTVQCGGTVTLHASGGSGGTLYWQGITSGGISTATASAS